MFSLADDIIILLTFFDFIFGYVFIYFLSSGMFVQFSIFTLYSLTRFFRDYLWLHIVYKEDVEQVFCHLNLQFSNVHLYCSRVSCLMRHLQPHKFSFHHLRLNIGLPCKATVTEPVLVVLSSWRSRNLPKWQQNALLSSAWPKLIYCCT